MNPQVAVDAGPESLFADILRPDTNIVTAKRSLDRSVVRALEKVAGGDEFERSARMDVRRPDPSPLLEAITDSVAREFLARDIAWLVGEFGAILDRQHLHAELYVARTDACRKFHADNVVMRLLCTYAGPGTEWIADADVVRANLARMDVGIEDANRSVLRRDDAVHHCEVGEVIILEGKASPGNRHGGAVHRSPPLEARGLSRLVLKIDEHDCGC